MRYITQIFIFVLYRFSKSASSFGLCFSLKFVAMKKRYVLSAGVFSLICLSCQNEIDPGTPNSTDIKIEASFQTNKISKDVEILSKEDAMSVAAIFADANLTRSGSRQVRNVVAINDETGNPLMYAVNFDE